jgi:hypothetical protein
MNVVHNMFVVNTRTAFPVTSAGNVFARLEKDYTWIVA